MGRYTSKYTGPEIDAKLDAITPQSLTKILVGKYDIGGSTISELDLTELAADYTHLLITVAGIGNNEEVVNYQKTCLVAIADLQTQPNVQVKIAINGWDDPIIVYFYNDSGYLN